MRVQSRLVATESGEQLWAAEFNRAHSKLFALQDALTCGIMDGVNQKLLQLEARRIQWCDPGSLQAWELAVRGSQLFYRRTASDNQAARDLLARAVREDQTLAWAYFLCDDLPAGHHQSVVGGATGLSERLGRGGSPVRTLALWRCAHGRHPSLFDDLSRQARSRCRASPARNQQCAQPQFRILAVRANHGHGQRSGPRHRAVELAMRLSPRDSDLWSVQTSIALAHFVAERYDLTRSGRNRPYSCDPILPSRSELWLPRARWQATSPEPRSP